jgi:hypothetical protein
MTPRSRLFFVALLGWVSLSLFAQEAPRYPTVRVTDLPDAIHKLYKREEPNFTDQSHCAAAWDSATDGDRIAFKCSVFIKMSAEGERRAMRYCEEIRANKKISAACRLIVD